jgi:monothiol glutaredoxin
MSDVQARIAEDVKNNDVLLYMKGTPVFPQCGFSSMAVQILGKMGVKFKAVDVLADPEVRDGIKTFSNWPTIPQLYVKGEFVGGADILREMFEGEELKPFLIEKGVALEEEV